MMSTQKVAITVPTELVAIIDDISRQKGISRSKLISNILKEKILNEKEKQIKAAYNRVFSDALILKEQIDTASWFEGAGNKKGQEW
jgi:metal-responsive CopG/Arc/MetJ family transcriptional regulator